MRAAGIEPAVSSLATRRDTTSLCPRLCPRSESNRVLRFTKAVLRLGATGALHAELELNQPRSVLETNPLPEAGACGTSARMGSWLHRLSSVDRVNRSAHCSACGPTSIRKRGADKWRCCAAGQGDPRRLRRRRQRKYGISEEEISAIVAGQGGVCAICFGPPAAYGKFAVDHDHSTGEVRGLLCSTCNSGIGLLQDDPVVLESAARYLRAWRQKRKRAESVSRLGP